VQPSKNRTCEPTEARGATKCTPGSGGRAHTWELVCSWRFPVGEGGREGEGQKGTLAYSVKTMSSARASHLAVLTRSHPGSRSCCGRSVRRSGRCRSRPRPRAWTEVSSPARFPASTAMPPRLGWPACARRRTTRRQRGGPPGGARHGRRGGRQGLQWIEGLDKTSVWVLGALCGICL